LAEVTLLRGNPQPEAAIEPDGFLYMPRGSEQVVTDWAALAPSEHIAQFYQDDEELLDTLTAFVAEGVKAGESTIVIATPEHLRALRHRLLEVDVDMMRAMFEDRYIAFEAHVGLTGFMVNDLPDEKLFGEFARSLLRRASVQNRKVRAFGEMVALLWARGNREATVRLEQFWERFCNTHAIAVLCSYPSAGFLNSQIGDTSGVSDDAVAQIRAAHTRII
jgi:MEDS: MEthanogen/methylotroph, DcmR Sensory domain